MEPVTFAHLTDTHINAPGKNNPVSAKNGTMLVQPQYLPGEQRVVYELDMTATESRV